MNQQLRIRRGEGGQFIGNLAKDEAKRNAEERAIQRSFTEWCRFCLRDDVLAFAIINEGAQKESGKFIPVGLLPGAADYCIVFQGRAHFIEMKSPSGSQQPNQLEFERSAERAGARYAIARSSRDAIRHLDRWGIPHREKAA